MATLALNLFGLLRATGGAGAAGPFSPLAFGLGAAGLLLGGHTKQVIEGPRQRDLSPPNSRVGNPICKVFGEIPVVGDIIWAEKVRETKHKKEEGGKGQPSVETISYTYSGSFAILVCEGPIERLLQIRVNDKLVWDYNGGDEMGKSAYVGKKKGTSYFTYDEATGTYTSNNGRVRIRTGTQTQLPDAIEEADKGVGKVPAYRGRVVLHFEDMDLTEFMGRHPQITVLVKEKTTNVASICKWILDTAGLDETEDYEVCELAGDHLSGMIIDERVEARVPLEKLGLAYQSDFPERDWKIRALKRGRPIALGIPYGDMRTHDLGAPVPEAMWSRERLLAVPRRLEVAHLDAARRWTVNSGAAWREADGEEDNRENLDLSTLSLSNPQARRIAEIELHKRRTERVSTRLQLPPSYAYLANGDAVRATISDTTRAVLLRESQESLFGTVSFAAVGYDPDDYDFPIGEDGEGLPDTVLVGTNGTLYAVIDSNSVDDNLNDQQMLYIAASTPYNEDFGRVYLLSYAFLPDGKDIEKEVQIRIRQRATMGKTQSGLSPFPPGAELGGVASSVIDDVNTLTVDLFSGELSSVEDRDLFSGSNRAFVGQEMIRFGVATFIEVRPDGTHRYELSRLVRGDRGTEAFMDEHETGEVFLLLDSAVKPVPYRLGYINTPFEIRAQTDGEDTFSVAVQPQARNLWPYSPYLADGARNEAGDLTITWERRSRYSSSTFWTTGQGPILGEGSERYDLEVLNGAGAVVRTLTDLTARSTVYTATEATADGLTPGDPVTVRIYMKSDVVNRGYPLEVTL